MLQHGRSRARKLSVSATRRRKILPEPYHSRIRAAVPHLRMRPSGTCESGDLMRARRKSTRGCAIFEAVKQARIGTEPAEIARAGEDLRGFAPRHPTLAELEVRIRQARRIRTLLHRLSKLV